LLLAAPLQAEHLHITVAADTLLQAEYLHMTVAIMGAFGSRVPLTALTKQSTYSLRLLLGAFLNAEYLHIKVAV